MIDTETPAQSNGHAPAEPPDVRFGQARGNVMAHEWAAYMMGLWFTAGSSKLSFADAVKATAAHFMLEGQQ